MILADEPLVWLYAASTICQTAGMEVLVQTLEKAGTPP